MPHATAAVRTRAKRKSKKPPRVPYTHKPEAMELVDWQLALRRQYARESTQPLVIRNTGDVAVFSEFSVTNPATKRTYRVVIRGIEPGMNYCSCPDYAVNTLGTCKHIEGTLHRLRRKHAAALKRGYVPPFAEVYVRYGAQRRLVFSPGADCPAALSELAANYFDGEGALKSAAYGEFGRFVEDARRIGHDLRVYDDALALIAEVRDGRARAERLRQRYARINARGAWDQLLKASLLPYQREGALFAAQAGRAIIADEMGLGKTIEAIAAAEMLARDGAVERALIVCPSSLKSQWQQEIGRFSERSAAIVEGLTHRRKAIYLDDPSFFKIVNYDVVHRDLEAIGAWSPDLVILDEAQRIKNWRTRAAKTVKQLASRYAIVLTGTPLENRLDELHSIVEFVDRFRLGPLFAFKAAHEVCEEDSIKVIGYRDLNRIRETLAPILIRRTKKEVLSQLPQRMDKNFFVPMTEPQWKHHQENQEIVARLVSKWRRYKFLTEGDQLRLRIALQNMRMSCDSTYLIDHETKHGQKVGELATLLGEVLEDPASKVVIFSQWVRMNELVSEMLEERRWGYVHLHGGVPSSQRKHLTRALKEDAKCRVFLSTDAGGVGLNLQTASTVVNLDLPWNPAVLEQRIGRVHRMGQERPVRVVNLVAERTIEHGMLSLLAFKQSMFAGVLDGAADRVFMGDSAMNRFMKTVEQATTSVPAGPVPVVAPDEDLEADESGDDTDDDAPVDARRPTRQTPKGDGGALTDLLTQGAQWLRQIAVAMNVPEDTRGNRNGKRRPLIGTDPVTGCAELRLPLPNDALVRQVTGFLTALLAAPSSPTATKPGSGR